MRRDFAQAFVPCCVQAVLRPLREGVKLTLCVAREDDWDTHCDSIYAGMEARTYRGLSH